MSPALSKYLAVGSYGLECVLARSTKSLHYFTAIRTGRMRTCAFGATRSIACFEQITEKRTVEMTVSDS